MRAYLLGGLIVVGLALAAGKTAAHHSFAAEFDRNKPITLTGTVTKVEWTNPHVWFYINVKDEAGKVTNWGAEFGPPHGLQRSGWRRDTVKLGEKVTVTEAALAKNGSKRVNAGTVTLKSTGGRPGQTLDAASSAGTNP